MCVITHDFISIQCVDLFFFHTYNNSLSLHRSLQYTKKGTDIVMPMKAEEEVVPVSTVSTTSSSSGSSSSAVSSINNLSAPSTVDDDEDVMKLLEEDET